MLPEKHEVSFLRIRNMAFKLSHAVSIPEPSSNLGECASAPASALEAENARVNLSYSPHKEAALNKRIPSGVVTGEITLESAKAYPIRIFEGTGLAPRIAYADQNTHRERNTLSVKLLPNGGKTAPHPQIVLFVNGSYHVESLGYNVSDPFAWTTWFEAHLDARELKRLIDAVIKAEIALENIKQEKET
jgi:hypothetical protein